MRYVHDTTGHTANENDAAGGFPFHQVFGNTNGKEVRSVDVDAPQFSHPVNRVIDGLKVLGEASRCDEIVNLAMFS